MVDKGSVPNSKKGAKRHVLVKGKEKPMGLDEQKIKSDAAWDGEDRLSDLGIPVMYGFPFGHISNQFTFPVGMKAVLNTKKKSLDLVETAVV